MRTLIDGTPRRAYDDAGAIGSACIIATDVLKTGRSRGWVGSVEEVAAVAEALAPLGIKYVDDLWGEWRPQPHAKIAPTEARRAIARARYAIENARVMSPLNRDEARGALTHADQCLTDRGAS